MQENVDDIGLPVLDLPEIVGMLLDLKIDQPNLVPGPSQLGGDQLDSQGLEPQEDLRVHERAGMDCQDFHGESSRGRFNLKRI